MSFQSGAQRLWVALALVKCQVEARSQRPGALVATVHRARVQEVILALRCVARAEGQDRAGHGSHARASNCTSRPAEKAYLSALGCHPKANAKRLARCCLVRKKSLCILQRWGASPQKLYVSVLPPTVWIEDDVASFVGRTP